MRTVAGSPYKKIFDDTLGKAYMDAMLEYEDMTDEEKALCRQAISDYKMIRPVVQFGDLYRLHSPYAGDNLASLMYVSEDKQKAVFYWYKLETFKDEHFPPVKMQGLDPNKKYTVHELNRIDKNPLLVHSCFVKRYCFVALCVHCLDF